jgi:hypothetical protein
MSMKTNRRFLRATDRLLVGDTSRVLIAAVAAGGGAVVAATYRIVIFRVIATILTSAAQSVQVGQNAGGVTKQAFVIPASAVGTVHFESEEGWRGLDVTTAFSAVPAAAGPAVHFDIEYTIEQLTWDK